MRELLSGHDNLYCAHFGAACNPADDIAARPPAGYWMESRHASQHEARRLVPWTDEERTLLRQLWENGMGPVLIGRLMGRSKYSVTKQTQALQLPKMRQQPGAAPAAGTTPATTTAAATRRPHAAAAADLS